MQTELQRKDRLFIPQYYFIKLLSISLNLRSICYLCQCIQLLMQKEHFCNNTLLFNDYFPLMGIGSNNSINTYVIWDLWIFLGGKMIEIHCYIINKKLNIGTLKVYSRKKYSNLKKNKINYISFLIKNLNTYF